MLNFDRRVVRHRYIGANLAVEIADPTGAGWYDYDWVDFEPRLDLLRRYGLRPGARVFDLGAHQGVVGLVLGHHVGAGGQVVLIEPDPHNFAQCRRNAELNAMPSAKTHKVAYAMRDVTPVWRHIITAHRVLYFWHSVGNKFAVPCQ
jgi:16S rRNA G1207 methylase RsmC